MKSLNTRPVGKRYREWFNTMRFLYICLGDLWSTRERLMLKDAQVASNMGHIVSIYCLKGTRLEELSLEQGFQVFHHSGKTSFKFFEMRQIFYLNHIIRSFDIDLVHCYESGLLWPLCYFLKKKKEIPLIFTANKKLRSTYRNLWYSSLKNRIDHVLVSSEILIDDVAFDLGLSEKMILPTGLGLAGYCELGWDNRTTYLKRHGIDPTNKLIGVFIPNDYQPFEKVKTLFYSLIGIREKYEQEVSFFFISSCPWNKHKLYRNIYNMAQEFMLESKIAFCHENGQEVVLHYLDLWLSVMDNDTFEDWNILALLHFTPVLFPRCKYSTELLTRYPGCGSSYKLDDPRELAVKAIEILRNGLAHQVAFSLLSSKIIEYYGQECYSYFIKWTYDRALKNRKGI